MILLCRFTDSTWRISLFSRETWYIRTPNIIALDNNEISTIIHSTLKCISPDPNDPSLAVFLHYFHTEQESIKSRY